MCSSTSGEGGAVRVLQGDLFRSGAQTLVNTVNCVGVMGKGIALEFKKRFPDMFEDYARRCDAGEVRLGQPYLYRRPAPPQIVVFPTKSHWRAFSRIEDIIAGLEYLVDHAEEWGVKSIAVPPLGCGNGQLDWRIVGPTLYRYLAQLRVPVELYAPWDAPAEQLSLAFFQERTATAAGQHDSLWPGVIAIVEVLRRLEAEPHAHPTGRIKLQKLAYFATAMGLPTGLTFRRSSYGPYSEELKGTLSRLINNGVLCEERRGRMFRARPGATYLDARDRFSGELAEYEGTIDQLHDLFARMDTTAAELAATVHFAAEELRQGHYTPTELEVLNSVVEWKQRRKPPFQEAEIAAMIREMAAIGHLQVRGSAELPIAEESALADWA